MTTLMKTIHYRFEGFDEVHQAEEWCLESTIEETRSRLAIPIWIDYKIIQDAHPEPHPELATYISNVCSPAKPTVVPKRVRKVKSEQKTSNLQPMLVTLDNTPPVSMVQEVLRDRMDGSVPTLPHGLD